jgi:putative endonuclease
MASFARSPTRTPRHLIRPATADSTTGNNPDAKRAALLAGKTAEAAVASDLERRGIAILHTNLRLGRLELDIVAKDADTVVVVEVRTRGTTAWQTGMESIARVKAKRVRAAGERLWRQRFLRDPTVNRMRFDVAVVTFDSAGAPSIEYAHGVF